MIQLTRRELLAGTAATTAALAMGLSASELQAAAPAVGKQNAGFYRYKVGDIEVTVVTDGVNRFKLPDTFVTNVKPTRSRRRWPRRIWTARSSTTPIRRSW